MISSIFALKGPITPSTFAHLWTPSIWKAFMDVQMKGSRHTTLPALEDGVTI